MFRFAVYYYELAHVGNALTLTSPSGASFSAGNRQEEDQDVNMIFVTLKSPEVGWIGYSGYFLEYTRPPLSPKSGQIEFLEQESCTRIAEVLELKMKVLPCIYDSSWL